MDLNRGVSLLSEGTGDTEDEISPPVCPSIPSSIDTIRYGLVVSSTNFYTLIAPTPMEVIQLENLRTKSSSIGNAINVDDLHFIKIVSALSTSAVPNETLNCKELINEVNSVHLNNCNLVASCNAEIMDVLIDANTLEWYANIDRRIVNRKINIETFLGAYHACIDSPILTEVDGVTASNTLWNRVLQVYPNNSHKPHVIVNPYSMTYSLFTIFKEKIVYTRYARYRHPIFDDYVERKVLKAEDITKAVFATSGSSVSKVTGASLGC